MIFWSYINVYFHITFVCECAKFLSICMDHWSMHAMLGGFVENDLYFCIHIYKKNDEYLKCQ